MIDYKNLTYKEPNPSIWRMIGETLVLALFFAMFGFFLCIISVP